MEKSEIIFFAIVIIAYLICALTLGIPTFVHYVFIAILLVVLIITLSLKYHKKHENKKIGKIFDILAVAFLAFYIISAIFESIYHKALIIDSSILLMPFFAALMLSWFLKNNE